MDRKSYIEELTKNLSSLSKSERDEAIKYYEEYFDEAGIENEKAVMSDFGTPEKLASNILKEYNIKSENNEKVDYESLSTNIKENTDRVKKSANKNVVSVGILVAILILGFPIYFPILATIFGVSIAFFASGIALIIAAIALFGFSFTLVVSNIFSFMIMCGISLILFSIGLMLTVLMVKIVGKFIPWLVRSVVGLFQQIFSVGGDN